MKRDDVNVEAAAIACLSELVELLIEEGRARAGEVEGLLAYQALTRLKENAEAYGVPLDRIGLDKFDPDSLREQATAAI